MIKARYRKIDSKIANIFLVSDLESIIKLKEKICEDLFNSSYIIYALDERTQRAKVVSEIRKNIDMQLDKLYFACSRRELKVAINVINSRDLVLVES